MRLVDLSHSIEHGTITYPGLPGPEISDYLSREDSKSRYESGTTFQIARIDLVANTGTYLDAPSHRYQGARDLADLSLEQLAGLDSVIIEASTVREGISESHFSRVSLRGRGVLVRTGWSRHFGTPAYGSGHPFLTEDAARFLVQSGAVLVGIDSLNIDDIRGKTRPVHSALLAANIPILEHLTNLEQLPEQGFRLFAVPPKFRGVGSFPVRAFAMVDD